MLGHNLDHDHPAYGRKEEIIFGFLEGSKGSGEESYTLRVPFMVSPNATLTVSSETSPPTVDGHSAAIFESPGSYVLEVYGFASEEAARSFLPKVGAGLIETALRRRISFPFTLRTAPVKYFDPPRDLVPENPATKHLWDKGWSQLDGYYPHDATVIKPEHKKLYVEYVGGGTLSLVVGDEDIAHEVSEALSVLPYPERVFEDEKLRLALNLYNSAFFEKGDPARLIAFVTVLETLNPGGEVPQPVSDVVDELVDKVKESQAAITNSPGCSSSDYDSLLTSVRRLKELSIGRGIRRLVTEKLELDPDIEDAVAVGREVREIYNLRSKLVHHGSADEAEVRAAIRRLLDIVPRVLLVMLSQAAQGAEA